MKINRTFINIVKGAVIGLACIVPGVSGGTLAVILGVYDKILYSISHLRRDFKNSFIFLWPIILGIAIGLGAMVYPITLSFEHFPLPTILLFAGLIVGSLPGLFPSIQKKPTASGIIAAILAVGLAIGLCFIGSGADADLSSNMIWYMYFIVIAIGIAGSCALTIPGISGSMLLLILGFYNPILNCIKSIFSGTDIGHNILVILCFGVGIILGFILISKLMTFLLSKFHYQTYMAIIGFIIASIFSLFYQLKDNFIPEGIPWVVILIGIILFILGFFTTFFLTRYFEKKEKSKVIGRNERGQEDDENR